jgi:hypothetical protein
MLARCAGAALTRSCPAGWRGLSSAMAEAVEPATIAGLRHDDPSLSYEYVQNTLPISTALVCRARIFHQS